MTESGQISLRGRVALWDGSCLREMYAAFVAAFREASEKWRAGDRTASFPVGSFPPGLPFVSAEAAGSNLTEEREAQRQR